LILYAADTKGFIVLLRLRRRKKGELKKCSWTHYVIENEYRTNFGILRTHDVYENTSLIS
jgi:hypothetical protein